MTGKWYISVLFYYIIKLCGQTSFSPKIQRREWILVVLHHKK